MEELLNQISAELSRNDTDPIWIFVVDLDYAYRQMNIAPETSKHCKFTITGEKIPRENRPHARTRNTRVARRYCRRHTRYKRRTHEKTGISTHRNRK